MKKFYFLLAVAVLAGLYLFLNKRNIAFVPTESKIEKVKIKEIAQKEEIKIIAENLEIPWEIAFLPDGEMLVTERPGRLLKIGQDKIAIPMAGVKHTGEGGLLGMALHPDFAQNKFVYLYMTTAANGGTTNRVERYKLEGNTLTDREIIIDKIPGSFFHDGGRIAFGPNKMLYITTGDAGVSRSAQDLNSLAGKILRLKDDGAIPPDNPFAGSPIYSYGHRNPQGLAWDGKGRLWATEHGRSGIQSGMDELNLIERGANYGWPEIEGDEERNGMIKPKINSGAEETWAPSGMAYYKNKIFFAGLRGESLYAVDVLDNGEIGNIRRYFVGTYGRLRAVAVADEHLYISTSNRDGRGSVQKGDDKIIKISLDFLIK